MANNTKQKHYQIVINGIQESVDAVKALNAQLDALEVKINSLQGKVINVTTNNVQTTTSNGGGSNAGELDAEAKLKQQIVNMEDKIIGARTDEYQILLQQKQELKEINQLQKENVAAANLEGKAYANTMNGMKAHLADIKAVLHNTDLNDTEGIQRLTTEANELTQKLKEMEQAYGVFGRSVGNYAEGVAEGMARAGQSATSIKVEINGVTREFNDARQASRELGNELKSMAIQGKQGTDEFKEMQKAVAQLNSDIKDATVSSKAMDNMLDTLQGFTAIGSIGEGISALFGIDDDAIERSIQKLVALQNVMQGIEEIRQQMNTGEGIGGWISKGNDAIDTFVEKLLGANKAQQALNASTTAGTVATNGLAAAQKGQAVATTTATVATKALGVALKAIGIGLIISLVATLITYWEDIYKWFTDTIPALKNLSVWFDKVRAVAVGVGTAIVNYMVQPLATMGKVIKDLIEGNFSQIPTDIANGFKKTFNVIGNYQKGYHKEIERQQKVHNEKVRENQRKANEQMLKDEEAKYGKSHKRTQEYLKKQMALTKEGSEEHQELQRQLWADEREEREENNRKTKNANAKNARDSQNETKTVLDNINALRLRLMKEGLQKTLAQLQENRKKEIAELKGTAEEIAEQTKLINEAYERDVYNARKEHIDKMVDLERGYWNEVLQLQQQNIDEAYSNNILALQNNTNIQLSRPLKDWEDGYGKPLENHATIDYIKQITTLQELNKIIEKSTDARKELAKVIEFEKKRLDELRDSFKNLSESQTSEEKKEINEYNKKISEEYEPLFFSYIKHMEAFENELPMTLEDAYHKKIKALEMYDKQVLDMQEQEYDKELKLAKKHVEDLYQIEYQKRNDEIAQKFGGTTSLSMSAITYTETAVENPSQAEKELAEIEAAYAHLVERQKQLLEQAQRQREDNLISEQELADRQKQIYSELGGEIGERYRNEEITFETFMRTMSSMYDAYENEITNKTKAKTEQLRKLELDSLKKLQQARSRYYGNEVEAYNEFYNELSRRVQQQPVYDKIGFGVINLKQTRANYKALLAMTEELTSEVKAKKKRLQEDLNSNRISFDDFKTANKQLDNLENSLTDSCENVQRDLKELSGKWWGSIHNWIQEVGSSVNDILGSLSEIQSNRYEAMISDQEKWIEKYEQLLSEQEEITEKHSNRIDDIESELAESRGSRRQYLIDQLNAEMEAQRASLAEEKRIEKEKERADKKKKELEHDQAVNEKRMALWQAAINASMAISMAAVNKWPIPAVPMMALAAAVGAAQIAAIKSQNIPSYGKGGLLVGKSHAQGGIKTSVGNTPIELEGREYVIRKTTTEKNIELLEYINKSQRKLNLEDFINFYSSPKVKKNIASIKSKFADGGQIPMLRTDISINDRLITAFEDYSNRPQVVSVVEIADKMDSVKKVQTLAGLE